MMINTIKNTEFIPAKPNRQLSSFLIVAIIFSCLISASVNAQTATTESMPMEKCALHETATKDGKFNVTLEHAGATGFQWVVELPKKTSVRLLQQSEVAANQEVVGAPVKQLWSFKIANAKRLKQVELDFYLYRVWEGKDRASKHCVVKVEVK